MPPPVTPEHILENAPRASRVLKIDVNVIAYFGDLFHAIQEGLKQGINEAPATSARTNRSNTASARNRS